MPAMLAGAAKGDIVAKTRLDVALVERGLAETRATAQRMIMAGLVFSRDRRLDKARQALAEDLPLEVRGQPHPYVTRGGLKLEKALDQQLIAQSREAIDHGTRVSFTSKITNVNRTVGTMLGHEVTKTYGAQGLPDGTIIVDFTGSAGNSFGAFVPKGITLRLEGDANDFVGKGLSGGRLVVRPARNAPAAFGATAGKIFLRGIVGERFCVRNSGATAVVEGVGDHGCEYMTGGRVVVLGETGRNFAAGMSGGMAFVYDPDAKLADNLNTELVDLEPLEDEDIEFLAAIIDEHRAETESPVAAALLADWDTAQTKFAKVMPRDYKRVLLAISEAEKTGRDVNEAIMEAARG